MTGVWKLVSDWTLFRVLCSALKPPLAALSTCTTCAFRASTLLSATTSILLPSSWLYVPHDLWSQSLTPEPQQDSVRKSLSVSPKAHWTSCNRLVCTTVTVQIRTVLTRLLPGLLESARRLDWQLCRWRAQDLGRQYPRLSVQRRQGLYLQLHRWSTLGRQYGLAGQGTFEPLVLRSVTNVPYPRRLRTTRPPRTRGMSRANKPVPPRPRRAWPSCASSRPVTWFRWISPPTPWPCCSPSSTTSLLLNLSGPLFKLLNVTLLYSFVGQLGASFVHSKSALITNSSKFRCEFKSPEIQSLWMGHRSLQSF